MGVSHVAPIVTLSVRDTGAGPFVEVAGNPKIAPWTTYFPDVSSNQGSVIDFRQIAHDARKTGITACEIKATESLSYMNPYFLEWRDDAERWGIRTFAYHFARPDLNPGTAGAELEAEHFCRIVQTVRAGEWRPMLDAETLPASEQWIRAWNARVRKLLGVAPTIYSYWSYLVGMKLKTPLSDGLIFAYPNGLPRSAPVPPPWKRWVAHQYSWHGRVGGINGAVDLNWTGSVRAMLAHPAQGAALEPVYLKRRRSA